MGCGGAANAPPPATGSHAPRDTASEPGARGSEEDGHHEHGHHEHGDGPLVRRFDQDPEYWVGRFEGPERDAYQKPAEVVQAMGIEPGMDVVDLGTGTGYFVPHLAPLVGEHGRIHALDIEPKLVAYVKERAARDGLDNVHARLVKGDDPALPDASIDRVLIVNTWHHIPTRNAYSLKLARSLKPSGQIWVVDFTMKTTRGPAKSHRILPEQVAAELSQAGLFTRVDDTLLPDQYIVVGTKAAASPAR